MYIESGCKKSIIIIIIIVVIIIIIQNVATMIPASISARLPPHAEAMEEEPEGGIGGCGRGGGAHGEVVSCANFTIHFKSTLQYIMYQVGCFRSGSPLDSSTSAVTLMVKGKSLGMTGLRAFSASAPSRAKKRIISEKSHGK